MVIVCILNISLSGYCFFRYLLFKQPYADVFQDRYRVVSLP